MPIYRYKAINADGVTAEGTLTAPGRQEALSMLRQRQNHPVSIEEEVNRNITLKRHKGVKAKDLSVFCRQFYSMLNAGVNIMNCLDILRTQMENKILRDVTSDIYENVQKGLTLSEAMRRNEKVFPPLFLNMIMAGEVSGTLDDIMKRLALHYEKEYKLNNKIKSALIYPAVLVVAVVAVVMFLITFVMPTYIELFSGSNVPLPAPTLIVIGISKFVRTYWYLIILATLLIVVGVRSYIESKEGRRHLDELKLKLPVLKDLNQKIVSARFTRTMSTMMISGIPLLQAIDSVSGVVNNVVIKEGMGKIYDAVRSGKILSDPVRASGIFPPMVGNMIKIGEESGTMDDLLDKAADFFDEEVDRSVQRLTTLFEPMMIVVMGLIVGFIVVAMLMPMFDMVKAI